MWIFSVVPDMLIHLILFCGILGLALSFTFGNLPFFRTYNLAVKICSILAVTLGLFLEGGLANEKEWQLKVAQLEVKIKEAEAKSAVKNVEIQEKVVTKTEVVKQRGRDIVQYVDRIVTKEIPKEVPGPEREKIVEVIKYVENCPVPQLIIEQHNAATELNKAAQKPEKDKK